MATRIENIIRNSIKEGKADIADKLCSKYGTCDDCPVYDVCEADQDGGHNGFYEVIDGIVEYLFEEV